jgi:predicted enzyme related to lactoylglutathione lyase
VDIGVPDLEAARAFYGPLFGWEFIVGPQETGFYTTCLVNGEAAAAIGGQMPGDESPPSWTVYIATADAGADSARIEGNGGTLVVPPMPVLDFGTMVVFADDTGAVAGLWQSGTHTGADIVDEPGAVVWTEQLSHDLEKAKTFYSAVFGYTYTDMSVEGAPYASFEVDGVTRGGLGTITPDLGDVPPHWLTYFAVRDTDAAVEYVASHGGEVVSPPADTQFGRIAVVRGPWRETFAVLTPPA